MKTLSFALMALLMAASASAQTYVPTESFPNSDLCHGDERSTLMESSDTNNDKLTTPCMTMDHAVEFERLRYGRYPLETGTATAPTTQTRLLDPDPETIGFYNQRKWSRLSIGAFENALLAKISWARMLGRSFELGWFVRGTRFDIDPEEFWYSIQVRGQMKLFLLQPRGVSPLGVYGGGFLGWSNYFLGSFVTENINTLHYGAEVGGYLHLGGDDVLFIPRAALQFGRISYLGSDTPPAHVLRAGVAEEGTFTALLLGIDASLGGLVPGLLLTIRDGQQSATFRLTFTR